MALQTYKVELQASAERHREIAERANIDFRGKPSRVARLKLDPSVHEDAAVLEALGNPAPLPPIETVKVVLDASIPEHAAILERFAAFSGRDAQEWIRLHLFRAVMDIEPRSVSASAAAKSRGRNTPKAARGSAVEAPRNVASTPDRKPTKPAFGAIPGIGG